MAKMIQIRHVPDSLHRRLRMRAALAGMSLSDYLRLELARAQSVIAADGTLLTRDQRLARARGIRAKVQLA
jgi:plasmid stability protein